MAGAIGKAGENGEGAQLKLEPNHDCNVSLCTFRHQVLRGSGCMVLSPELGLLCNAAAWPEHGEGGEGVKNLQGWCAFLVKERDAGTL
jgi:hypothetical protein